MAENEYPKPIETPAVIQEIAAAVGGAITECAVLPDGSGFATMSMPLSKTHWIYQKDADGFSFPPPMPFRMGSTEHVVIAVFPNTGWPDRSVRLTREQFARRIWDAAKYAVRGATMHGAEMDFDPDALCQNLVVGMLGYWTADGRSGDAWANPPNEYRDEPPSTGAVDPQARSTGKASTRVEEND